MIALFLYHAFFSLTVGFFCAYVFEVPKRMIFQVSLIGMFGWLTYYFTQVLAGSTPVWSSYWASLVIAAMSQWAANRFHQPVTLFFIPGFIPIVPGGGLYRTALYLFQRDFDLFSSQLLETFMSTVAIGLAIFTVSSISYLGNRTTSAKYIRRDNRKRVRALFRKH
ncbi:MULTISPECIES: threonine/serine exporter family protein [Aerococcus]|uniref:Threonine/serine exporter family protein n=1 Tax=Aerococcus urinae TaxID=1376 RepID=A0A0X8FDB1_9LACT|nr:MULTISPECIES: threonine/serine exporter family protein [Aerococcus]AMB95249.1 hypothetical protein AWM73_01390 [Aerococcus urinae]MCY3031970.1 threonine/serine exporter family protein [Aerococcus urinae]MCY3035416.1 threonine/serine exporter family protein [Aerococcus sp. Group 2]MCY3037036.1 threonine/serine exporter family protein [Aerococcus urinae]MCY3038838.1 threonine/serine exporter family protein [Aerococcus sp. Group 2]